jgi:AraC-like DNA-binding protein
MNLWNSITVLSIDDVYFVPSERGHHHAIRDRKCYGLSFAYEGQITYRWEGQEFVSDQAHAILLPKGASYVLHRDASGVFPVINFSCTSELPIPPFIRVPLRNPQSYLKSCEHMRELWSMQRNPAKLLSMLYDLFAQVSEETEEPTHLLSPAIQYIGAHLNDPTLSNERLAKEANMSEVYFRKRFKEIYGVTPHQYLLELRIRQAKLLLSERAATVTAVSEACGFSSVYHFCRAFKQFTGMTPKEFAETVV